MSNKVNPFIKYPFYVETRPLAERIIVKAGHSLIKCLVCGRYALLRRIEENLRETCICSNCKSTNRQRQMAYVMLHAVKAISDQPIYSLADFTKLKNTVVYNTEAGGSLHTVLSRMNNYICSYYYGDQCRSGTVVNGVMHQDLMSLSFDDESIDMLISSDVFEHIADPYKAHTEVYRVLKKGGKHIFTVPFHAIGFVDSERARIGDDGHVMHIEEPIFHGDPVSLQSEGVLVFTIFSIEMLVKLAKIGFKTNFFHLWLPKHGILGQNAIVFEAIKE